MEWTSVKKGWVYQRKKHLLLPTSWSPKYLVLYSGPIPALAVYEQRSDAMPPYAPLLHIELAAGCGLVSVMSAHGSSSGGGFWGAVGQSVGSSRKASIVSGLHSRKDSMRDVSSVAEGKAKSYKERVLDEQGFMVMRESSPSHCALRLCFAVESGEEREAWLHEIQRVIDQAHRKHSSPILVTPTQKNKAESDGSVERQMAALTMRSESEDLSIACCGVKVLDHRAVKRILANGDQHSEDVDEEEEEITTSQIMHSSSSRLVPSSLIPGTSMCKAFPILPCIR